MRPLIGFLVALLAAFALLAGGSLARANAIKGATYDGPAASGGTVSFDVSADGTAVTQFRATDVPTTCGTITITASGTFTITNNAFSFSPPAGLRFSGSFTGSQQAEGVLSLKEPLFPSCTSDDISWSATTTAQPPQTLTVSKSGNGSGTVSSIPAGIDCGSTCSYDFDYGTSVTLSAAAASDSTFTGWSGACSGTGTCTLTMDAAKSVTASFALQATTTTTTTTTTGVGGGGGGSAIKCVVPKVTGKMLASARAAIKKAHCSVGKVTKKASAKVKKNRVISQKPSPGKKLAKGAKVNLVVSKGRRHA
jgi:hypothetical protein